MRRRGFCHRCCISWSMHDDEDDCEGAKARVEQLEEMERLFIRGVMG